MCPSIIAAGGRSVWLPQGCSEAEVKASRTGGGREDTEPWVDSFSHPQGLCGKADGGILPTRCQGEDMVNQRCPTAAPQRRSVSTLGNENLLRGGCKLQTFSVWVSNVHISGNFSNATNKCQLNGQMCTRFNISLTTSVLKHIRLQDEFVRFGWLN